VKLRYGVSQETVGIFGILFIGATTIGVVVILFGALVGLTK
jgi:hypothetical protein